MEINIDLVDVQLIPMISSFHLFQNLRVLHMYIVVFTDMKQCLMDASESLKKGLEEMLVFNEVTDVRVQQEKEVGKAEKDIEMCAERFCDPEQYRPEQHSDTGLLSSLNDSTYRSMTFFTCT